MSLYEVGVYIKLVIVVVVGIRDGEVEKILVVFLI